MNAVFVNDCAADGCYKKNLGKGKQMCKQHQQMYEEGKSFKAFYGKTVLKKDFQSIKKSKLITILLAVLLSPVLSVAQQRLIPNFKVTPKGVVVWRYTSPGEPIKHILSKGDTLIAYRRVVKIKKANR